MCAAVLTDALESCVGTLPGFTGALVFPMDQLWTIREAAAIANIPAKAIRAMIEREGLRPVFTPEGRRVAYRFSLRDLLYLKLRADFPFALSKADKIALEGLMRGRKTAAHGWRAASNELVLETESLTLSVNFAHLRDLLARNAAAYEWGQQRIASQRTVLGGEPVFRGTRIALAQVVGLVREGLCDAELAARFPELHQTDFDYARIHARLGKRPGRPRKPIELHRPAKAA
jgi:uncharacterized protein (DUF433 family)